MESKSWTKEEIDKFTEDNFIDEDLTDKITEFILGADAKMTTIPKEGDEQQIASLKIDMVLSVV